MSDVTAKPEARELEEPTRLPADHHPALVYLTSLPSEESRRTMRGTLNRIARTLSDGRWDAEAFPWPKLRYQHTQALRSWLVERYAPATVNKYLSALRGVLREAWRLELIDSEAYRRATDLESITAERLPQGRKLTLGELRSLKSVCDADDSPAGARDKALIATLARAGLRRAEVVELQLEDFSRRTEENGIAELVVRSGKGERDRIVPVAGGAREALEEWIEERGTVPGPLFCPVRKGGEIEIRKLSAQAVYNRVKRRQREADLDSFSPHDLRRTFISDLLDYGNDLSIARRLAGHADAQTTARYDRRGKKAEREAAGTLPF